MRKAESDTEIIAEAIPIEGETIVDIGCGTGSLVQWLRVQGGKALGLDTLEMLAKAIKTSPGARDLFVAGLAQALPFKKDSVDAVIYFASLHHVPKEDIFSALKECHRVLKSKGRAVILEPVGREGSYFEVIRLVEDEREIQAFTYSLIKSADNIGLRMIEEKFVFFERKYQDYQILIKTHIDDRDEAREALKGAKEVFSRYAHDRGVAWEDFSFRSFSRINILEKTV
jgi:ubiquinone/menaquinone biosynthesis C-methylase UbiE